jgi:hypothetical protein
LLPHEVVIDETSRTTEFSKMKYGEFLDIAKAIDFQNLRYEQKSDKLAPIILAK